MTSNPLTNVLTPQIRAWLYAGLFLASLGFGAWQAAGGDWYEFAAGLVTALLSATAASNASWTDTYDTDDEDYLDGEVDAEPLSAEEIASLPTEHVHGGLDENAPRAPQHRAEPLY